VTACPAIQTSPAEIGSAPLIADAAVVLPTPFATAWAAMRAVSMVIRSVKTCLYVILFTLTSQGFPVSVTHR
jgi:hypothetical protein